MPAAWTAVCSRDTLPPTSAPTPRPSAYWERGETEPALAFLPAILRFLGYDPRPEPTTLAERLVAVRHAPRSQPAARCRNRCTSTRPPSGVGSRASGSRAAGSLTTYRHGWKTLDQDACCTVRYRDTVSRAHPSLAQILVAGLVPESGRHRHPVHRNREPTLLVAGPRVSTATTRYPRTVRAPSTTLRVSLSLQQHRATSDPGGGAERRSLSTAQKRGGFRRLGWRPNQQNPPSNPFLVAHWLN